MNLQELVNVVKEHKEVNENTLQEWFDKNTPVEYEIKYWETEDAREQGISDILEIVKNNKELAIKKAKKFFDDSMARAVEVIKNSSDLIYHISYDEDGEIYTEVA